MIIGIGTDILNVDRILRSDEVFLNAVYTTDERKEAAARDNPNLYYATRFAGKEAVFKCLGEIQGEIRLNEIEILSGENGKPFVKLSGAFKSRADALGVRKFHISLSYDGEYAVSYAVAEA